MRLVEGVNLFLEYAPKWWVTIVVGAVAVFVVVTGNVAPVVWYVQETAASVTETVLPVLQNVITDLVAELELTATPTPTAP